MKNTQKMTRTFRTGKNTGFKAVLGGKGGNYNIFSFEGKKREIIGSLGLGKKNGNLDLSQKNIQEVLELCGFSWSKN